MTNKPKVNRCDRILEQAKTCGLNVLPACLKGWSIIRLNSLKKYIKPCQLFTTINVNVNGRMQDSASI